LYFSHSLHTVFTTVHAKFYSSSKPHLHLQLQLITSCLSLFVHSCSHDSKLHCHSSQLESTYTYSIGLTQRKWEQSGLLANSVCVVSKCVLWSFAVFCKCFKKTVFCGVWRFAGRCATFLTCFANVFLRIFSE